MTNNNDLINNLLANPIALWCNIGKLTIEPRNLSLNAIETLSRHFGLVEPKLDGDYTLSSRFDKSGLCKIKIGHKGEKGFTIITILNKRPPQQFKENILRPWELLHELEGVQGDMNLTGAWIGSALSRNRKQLFDKNGILRVPSGPYHAV